VNARINTTAIVILMLPWLLFNSKGLILLGFLNGISIAGIG
jgi:hypothetical protein